jgi:CBS domain-containing protein
MKQSLVIWEQRIHQSRSLEQLRSLRDQIQTDLHERLLFSSIVEWLEVVNTVHDRIIHRTVMLSEIAAENEGMGKPPVAYAFILFGSGGRSEQTLWSDQDNGLIYEQHSDEAVDQYFLHLAELIASGLETVGYPPCEGEVGASNAIWRKSDIRWREMIAGWFADGGWENVRQLLIVADARCVYGDEGLVNKLRSEYDELVADTPGILGVMLKNTLRHKVVLGPFGNLIREPYGEDAGGFDVKYGAYIPMVNAIRLLSIKQGIKSTSTNGRIEELSEFVGADLATKWGRTFEIILQLRSSTPYQLTEGQYTTRGKLQASSLTKEVTNQIKECLHVGEHLQKYIKRKFNG